MKGIFLVILVMGITSGSTSSRLLYITDITFVALTSKEATWCMGSIVLVLQLWEQISTLWHSWLDWGYSWRYLWVQIYTVYYKSPNRIMQMHQKMTPNHLTTGKVYCHRLMCKRTMERWINQKKKILGYISSPLEDIPLRCKQVNSSNQTLKHTAIKHYQMGTMQQLSNLIIMQQTVSKGAPLSLNC